MAYLNLDSPQQGPTYIVTAVCGKCRYLSGEPKEQYPSYTCTHFNAPLVTGPGCLVIRGYIGNRDNAPYWCPFRTRDEIKEE